MKKQLQDNNLSKNHIEKIKHRFDYIINESPTYRQLVKDSDEFDEVPNLTNEADDEPKEKPPVNPNDNEFAVGMDAPTPEFDDGENMGNEMPQDDMANGEMEVNPQQELDAIQNDIIKHNIEAAKETYDQILKLTNTVDQLNSKFDALNADVEEVREPTNVEKLMSKKNVSYPYYLNLNDFWKDNWFDQKRNGNDGESQGIKKLPDGTYVADFDDLPSTSSLDIKDSFDVLI